MVREASPRRENLLRSRSALDFGPDLTLPSPLPPLRDGVTEVHFSRWVVEESNKEIGDVAREEAAAKKAQKKSFDEGFLAVQHRKVEDIHHQMTSASAAVESIRIKNLEVGQEMRLKILELKQSISLEKQMHSAKGRELVEHAKHVQSAKVLERQLSARGRRQERGGSTKKERQKLAEAREAAQHAEEEKKKQIADRVKLETAKETIQKSLSVIEQERAAKGAACRVIEERNVLARQQARERFMSMSARTRKEAEAAHAGAKSAREGLTAHRRMQADMLRQAKTAELERKKALAEEKLQHNKTIHDLMYASKFAPRERARKVHLPGRIGDASAPAKVGDKAETRRQRTARRGAAPTSAASAAAAAAPTELPTTEEGLLALVRVRRDEVDCLLRVDLSSGEGIAWASRTVAESLTLDDELDLLALSHHVLKGKLFQGLIEALRAAGCGHAQFENSVKHIGGNMATELGISLVHWSRLTLQADAMRNLVRIKVADDNDLRTCREGLLLCDDFFRALQRLAELRGVSEHAVLQALDPAP